MAESGESKPTKSNSEPSKPGVNETGLKNEEKEESINVVWRLSKNEICQGEFVEISIDDVNQPLELNWNFGDGFKTEGVNANHRYLFPGEYTITLNAKLITNNKKYFSETRLIQVHEKPAANLVIEKNENMAAFPEVAYTNLSKSYSHALWVFEDEKFENINSVKKFYRNKGIYKIGLIIHNKFGCSDSSYKEVVVDNDYNLLAPNAFTPNSDGINDFFLPEGLAYLHKEFILRIFNPINGQIIFESNNLNIPWNGKSKNGDYLKMDSYPWTVKLEDDSKYSGTVLLLRD